MKIFGLRIIGIIILFIAIAYPINIYLQTGIPFKMILVGGAGNYPLISEIGLVIGAILIIISLKKGK
jgi:hypothetical protein